ncbi:hypothetical protein FS842_003615 [Serendipita sp. 407]|nr:hypothetical protein FRC18_011488 [Serendipita sp. 400]KAG8872900.1 hypothetical protein FRC20_008909 [Serendipita sp. 405]KAG9057853.1 hypothetical protein FS842_003615 [Serendipita sp. 407]
MKYGVRTQTPPPPKEIIEMDQDAFRDLLSSARTVPDRPSVTPAVFSKSFQKKSTTSQGSSVSAFKPRTHASQAKTKDASVGDRSQGVAMSLTTEYLDEETELIAPITKGLDFSLLERERSKLREEQSAIDDILLEEALQDATAPKKRTREEIVQSLKKSRTNSSSNTVNADGGLDAAKQAGKFRPIGAPEQSKPKKRKTKTEDPEASKKKKKRKLEDAQVNTLTGGQAVDSGLQQPGDLQPATSRSKARTSSPEIDADADIFSGIGQYKGIESGSDNESDDDVGPSNPPNPLISSAPNSDQNLTLPKANWFGEAIEDIPRPEPVRLTATKPETQKESTDDVEMEEAPPFMRLQGLSSSVMPSIKEILAMDEAAEREEKRKAKKEKKKNKKPSDETRINREVKEYVTMITLCCIQLILKQARKICLE